MNYLSKLCDRFGMLQSDFDYHVIRASMVQEALKHFPASGGSIINISSIASENPVPNSSLYSATKGAVDTLAMALAKELGPRNIRVNSINPGLVETEGTATAGTAEGDFRKWFETQAPLGRIGQPDDIGPAAVFLASDESGWITGETLAVAGGFR